MKLTQREEIKFIVDACELMDFINETPLKYWDNWDQNCFEKLKNDHSIMKKTFQIVKETSQPDWTSKSHSIYGRVHRNY